MWTVYVGKHCPQQSQERKEIKEDNMLSKLLLEFITGYSCKTALQCVVAEWKEFEGCFKQLIEQG